MTDEGPRARPYGRRVQRIIVGVDGPSRTAEALGFACRLARVYGARLTLVRVYSLQGAEDDFAGGLIFAGVARRDAETLVGAARRAVEKGIPTSRVAVPGESPALALASVARRQRAQLIVLGSTHVGPLGRIRPGATAERLLHVSPCPVAVVPAGYGGAPTSPLLRVGVATDHSREARMAMDGAVALARATHAELRVMTALESSWYATPALMSGPGWATIHDELLARVRAELEGTVAGLPGDVDANAVVLDGDVVDELVHHSRRLDVLFMGARGLRPLRSALAGGVSAHVVRDTHCPVIVTPASATAETLGVRPREPATTNARETDTGGRLLVRFLREHAIECAVTEHAETFTAAAEARATAVSPRRTAKSVMLHDGDGYVLALIPASARLDLAKARRLIGRPRLEIAQEAALATDFPRFEVGALPPFGALFGAPELIDDELLTPPRILCNGGDHCHSIVVDSRHLKIATGALSGDLATNGGEPCDP